MLPRSTRLNKKEFEEAFIKGQFFGGRTFDLKIYKNKKNEKRFSFVVPNKEVKKAHERNFLKRRGKYVVLKYKDNLKDGFDYIFLIKKGLIDTSFQDFEKQILDRLGKIGFKK